MSVEDPLSMEDAARRAQAHPFLIEATGRTISFEEAVHRVRSRAVALREQGIPWGEPRERFVAMVARASVDDLFTILALLAGGTAAVLLHPAWSEEERRTFIQRFGIEGEVLDGMSVPGVATTSLRSVDRGSRGAGSGHTQTNDDPPFPALERPEHFGWPGWPGWPEWSKEPERAAVVFGTSGTTGHPRAVVLGRGAIIASAAASASNLGWEPNDRWLLSLPTAHVGGFSVLARCLIARRTVVLARSRTPEAFMEAVERHAVTLASLVPTQLVRLLEGWPWWRPPSTLRAILLGGAAASPVLVKRARAAGYPILKTYGLTEAGSQVATERYRGPMSSEGAIGPPLSGVELRIDSDRILIRGPMLMRNAGGDWYDTGDRGYLTEAGELVVWGRGAELIISGGENVYPAEVEVVLREMEAIEDAVVFGMEDPEWGQAVSAVVRFVPGRHLAWPRIEKKLRIHLAGFKCPRRWVELDHFPRLPSGKVDRRAVCEAARLRLAVATCSTLTGEG